MHVRISKLRIVVVQTGHKASGSNSRFVKQTRHGEDRDKTGTRQGQDRDKTGTRQGQDRDKAWIRFGQNRDKAFRGLKKLSGGGWIGGCL